MELIKKDSYFENKIIISSFLLSILVIYIHANCLKDYGLQNNTSSIAYWVVKIITSGIGGIAVPMFFVISGYLYFRNIDFSIDIKSQVRRKQKGRVKSIIIPYLIWNTFGMLFYMIIPRIPIVNSVMNGSYVEINFMNIIRGILFHEYYFPLWYLKELIIIILLTMFVANILKNKKISMLVIGVLSVLAILDIKLKILKLTSVYFFFLGAFMAVYTKEYFEKQKSKRIVRLSIVLFIFLTSIRTLSNNNILTQCIYLISPLVLWTTLDLLANIFDISIFMKQSFFIYCSHIIIITSIDKLLIKLGNSNSEIWIIVSFLVAPIIALIIIYFIYLFLITYLNRFYRLVCGNRI